MRATIHWLSSTSRTAQFELISRTMCGKNVSDKAATRDHRDVTCVACMSAMDDWTRIRWEKMQEAIAAQERTPRRKPTS